MLSEDDSPESVVDDEKVPEEGEVVTDSNVEGEESGLNGSSDWMIENGEALFVVFGTVNGKAEGVSGHIELGEKGVGGTVKAAARKA